jgi:hypothetical protein
MKTLWSTLFLVVQTPLQPSPTRSVANRTCTWTYLRMRRMSPLAPVVDTTANTEDNVGSRTVLVGQPHWYVAQPPPHAPPVRSPAGVRACPDGRLSRALGSCWHQPVKCLHQVAFVIKFKIILFSLSIDIYVVTKISYICLKVFKFIGMERKFN